ncbi:hypothetical protein [uncultured Methanobacterium sp.]|uniref:hypothetical protein n=1 Tax=uncultured Methanobacterium sp. TaxID=176306 RepID=UPI002AA91C3D|nr:hypothetical protein [uncultured Methanobacterium sp.]
MISSFNQAIRSIANVDIIDDPYVKFIIDRRKHEGILFPNVTGSKECSFSHNEYELVSRFNKNFVMITGASTHNFLDIEVDFDVQETGFYRFEVLVLRGPDYEFGSVQILDGNVEIADPIGTNCTWLTRNWFKTRIREFKPGTRTVTVRISKNAGIAAIKIVPVVRHEGDSDGSYFGENELDILSANWSRNSINEVNTGTLTMPFQDEFYQSKHNYSPFIFSFKDSVTILVGGKRSQTMPIFGSFITGWDKKADLFTLGLHDTLINLNGDVMYENYAIGAPPEEGKVYRQFSNVNDTILYMAETAIQRINPLYVDQQEGFRLDFSSVTDYNSVVVSGFGKDRDATMASPGYCLKLYRANTGDASAILYQNTLNPYNAAEYKMLCIDYNAADAASAMAFDIYITMHKEGEDISKAVTYSIRLSGPGGANQIATVTPIWNGIWNYFSLDLNAIFIAAGIYSNKYYVSKIELKGNISSTNPEGAMYMNISNYKEISDTTRHSNEEVKSISEILQSLGEQSKHAIYIQPGLERCDDILVAQPFQNTTMPVTIDDSNNLIECEEYGSKPLEDGFLNQAHSSFNIDDTNIGSSFAEKLDSVIHYEEFQRHENSELKSQADVDKATQERVNNLSSLQEYLTCKFVGNPYLEPNQNIYYTIEEHRCSGFGMLKTIDYEYNPEETPILTTTTGINRPSSLYNELLFKTYRDIYNLKLLYPGGGDIYRSRIS